MLLQMNFSIFLMCVYTNFENILFYKYDFCCQYGHLYHTQERVVWGM